MIKLIISHNFLHFKIIPIKINIKIKLLNIKIIIWQKLFLN
jgi:hypothetical protein